LSTPQGPQDPYGPNPYADPVQEHIPEQGGDRGAGGQQSAYNGYPQGSGAQQDSGYQQGAGYQQGSGYGQQGSYQQGAGYAGGAGGYLQGAPVGFGGAVRGAFSHIATFRGRASRSAFWWFAILSAVAWAILGIIQDRSTVAGAILYVIIGLPLWIANLSLAVRRLHDSNHTGWWWWIGLIPLVGWIILLVFYVLPGTPGPNRYNRI
jgi:uncharacterized membrane protein YhaH (DUF805 family)